MSRLSLEKGCPIHKFTDAAPGHEVPTKIREYTLRVHATKDTHDLRIRTSGGLHSTDVHITVDGQMRVNEGHRVAKKVESSLMHGPPDIDRVMVHVEPIGDRGNRE